MNRAEALRLTCPKCGAPPHMPCMGKRGQRKAHHAERYSEQRDIGYRTSKAGRERARENRCNTPGWVYFIGTVGGDQVKIGWSKYDPQRRLSQLQTANSEQLHLYGAIRGTQRIEKALHDKFSEHHIRGEWFAFDIEIWSVIPEAADA